MVHKSGYHHIGCAYSKTLSAWWLLVLTGFLNHQEYQQRRQYLGMIQPPSSCHSIWLGFNFVSKCLTWRIRGGYPLLYFGKSSYLSNNVLTADWVGSTNYIGGKLSSNCCFMVLGIGKQRVCLAPSYINCTEFCVIGIGVPCNRYHHRDSTTISIFKSPYYVQIDLSFSTWWPIREALLFRQLLRTYRKARAHWLSRRLIAIRFDWCQTYRHPMHPQCWTRFEAGRVHNVYHPGDSKWPFHPLVGGHLTP